MEKTKRINFIVGILTVVMLVASAFVGLFVAKSQNKVFATVGYDAVNGRYTDPNGNVLEVIIDGSDVLVNPYFGDDGYIVGDEVIFPRPEDLGVESYIIGDFHECFNLETIYIPNGNITVSIGAFEYEVGQYSKLIPKLQDAYEDSDFVDFPGNKNVNDLTKVKNVFIGGSGVTFELGDGLGDSEDYEVTNGKMVPFFGIVNPFIGDAGWIPDDFLTEVRQAGCRIYVADDTNLPECYEYYSSIIETSTVVGTEVSVLSKMAAYEATYAPLTTPETGIVFDIILPSTIIGLVALATIVVWRKKEQY